MKILNFDEAFENADFIDEAHNIYRTKSYIVRQMLSTDVTENGNIIMISEDTYYVRTRKRDAEFDAIFGCREKVDGKRIRATMFTRTYID